MAKTSLPPGFRFYPTDIELVWYYLKRKITGKPSRFEAISEVQLYKFAPWDLPDKSCLLSKDLEWYFFCPRVRKYSHGCRTNRTTDIGYWKPTSRDKAIIYNSQTVGMKKTLTFYLGKSPKGSRTDWVMYEYRLDSSELANAGYIQDAYVLCKIFEISGRSPRNGEQHGASFEEEDWGDDANDEDDGSFPCISSAERGHLFCPAPVQAVAPQVDEPVSSMLSNFEVGEPSSMPSMQESSSLQSKFVVGEPSSMLGNFEAGETSCLPDPCADGIYLGQLETLLLNRALPYTENANAVELDLANMHEDAVQMSDSGLENIFNSFFDLTAPSFLELTDGIALSDIVGSDHELQPALPEFADGHDAEALSGYRYTFSNDYLDSVVNGFLASEARPTGPCASDDQLPPTLENDAFCHKKRDSS